MPDETSLHFGWVDYLIFTVTLGMSLLIGIYHAWKGSANSTMEYLWGGKTMGIFPIAMSFAASTLSTQNMLGTPTDVYLTGAMLFWVPVAFAIGALVGAYVFLPLFQELGVLSINEYLELRYHRFIRRWFSGINILGTLFWLSILTYGPSLALSQVTGLNVYLSATITFAVCTFYTTIGGMKAVVWSDTIQIFLMFGSIVVLVIKGLLDVGISNVWERNLNTSRLELFNIDPDPTAQKTVWSMIIGFGLFAIGVSANQGNFQRFLAVPSNLHAQKAVILNIFVVAIFYWFCCSSGLIAYAKYFDCDPIRAKLVKKEDQIVPYFMMDTIGSFPGLPGLFVAGCFSASLSTMSTVLNGCALTVYEDFVRPFFPNLTDKSATQISKSISFAFGLISYIMVFLISNVHSILEAGLSIAGANVGMNLGVFTLGMLIPWSNSIGAIVGMVVSYTAVILLGVFTQMAISQGNLAIRQLKPTSIENCPNLNATIGLFYTNSNQTTIREESFNLLKISYMWYTLIGVLIILAVGTVVSFITGPQDPGQLDPKLVYPFMRRWIGKKRAPSMQVELKTMPEEIDNNGKINKGFEN